MLRNLLVATFLILGFSYLSAQTKQRCGSDAKMEQHEKLHPFYLQSIDRGYENYKKQTRLIDEETLYIPIHVIVVHDPDDDIGEGTNHSPAKIQSQIDALNLDFTRTNADTMNTPDVFSQGNPNIVFCLAYIDPDGNPTEGITRFPSTQNFDDEELAIKTETGWPRTDYLNLWVAEIEDLGFAYIPSTSSLPNATLDGVVVDHETFGGPGTSALPPYNLGRTATHEIGHFLGLRHIWRGNGCTSDDGFDDTPIQDIENYGCPNHPSPSCDNNGDMFMNYMDYVDDNCMNAFTEDQSEFMRSILLGIRSSLLSSGIAMCSNAPFNIIVEYKKDIDCNGNNNGEIKVKPIGGSPEFIYTLNNVSNQNGVFTNLGKGIYKVFATDNTGTIDSISIEILEPEIIVINETVKNNVCFGDKKGSIRMAATGGVITTAYQFSKDGVTYTFNPNISNLENGFYTVYAKDINECIASKVVEITSPNKIAISINIVEPIICNGDANGKIQLVTTGGVESYIYKIDGATNPTNTFDNLSSKSYSFNITDANNCKLDTLFFLNHPAEIVSEIVTYDVKCFGENSGVVEVNTIGGIMPYSYSIDSEDYIETNKITNLFAGNHTLEIKDANNCVTEVIQFSINEPEELNVENVNFTLMGDEKFTLNVEANGGVKPYNYYIDISSSIQEDSIFNNVESGEHEVWVIDRNGCSNKQTILLTGTDEIDSKDEFSISPNPVIDNLVIKYFGNKEQEVKLEIFDISGRLLQRHERIKFSPEKNIHNFLVDNVANSILLIKIASKFKSSHIFIIKE